MNTKDTCAGSQQGYQAKSPSTVPHGHSVCQQSLKQTDIIIFYDQVIAYIIKKKFPQIEIKKKIQIFYNPPKDNFLLKFGNREHTGNKKEFIQ